MAVISRSEIVPCWKRSSSSVRMRMRRLVSSGSATAAACRSLLIFICPRQGWMGASWRPGAAAVLLLLALAAAPVAHAGTAQDPELTDPPGDQTIDRGAVPTVPNVNQPDFS